jgi:hypothetical protein
VSPPTTSPHQITCSNEGQRRRGSVGAQVRACKGAAPSPSSGPLISVADRGDHTLACHGTLPSTPLPLPAAPGGVSNWSGAAACESAEFEACGTKGRLALPAFYSHHWRLEKILRSKIKAGAAPTSPVLSAVRPQPSNDDSRGQEPLQARSCFASLPTGAELLLVGVVVQLLPIPSCSIRQCCVRGYLRQGEVRL